MSTRFIIPTATALSLHALAFFGFTHSNPPIRRDAPAIRRTEKPPLQRIEIELPLEPSNSAPAASGGKPDVVRSEEPPAPSDFSAFHPEVVIPRNSSVHADVIPSAPIGPGESNMTLPGNSVLPSTALDNPPRTRSQIRPSYPFDARQNGQKGEVLVEFTVDESGHVINPRVVRSTDAVFEVPTLNAVAKWRFEPGRKNGRAVRFRLAVQVEFSVND